MNDIMNEHVALGTENIMAFWTSVAAKRAYAFVRGSGRSSRSRSRRRRWEYARARMTCRVITQNHIFRDAHTITTLSINATWEKNHENTNTASYGFTGNK
jgi:hypothetical protein